MNRSLATIVASVLLLACPPPSLAQSQQGDDGYGCPMQGWGGCPGWGMGPGMMQGWGGGPGWGMGPGMMQGWGGGPGWGMGPGMMQRWGGGPGWGMGPGMMQGWGGGPGWGPGMMQQLTEPLTPDTVTQLLQRRLAMSGNKRLKLGKVTEEGGEIVAEIVTQDGSLVDKLGFDKQTGQQRRLQ